MPKRTNKIGAKIQSQEHGPHHVQTIQTMQQFKDLARNFGKWQG
jgi:hypothetical protein